MFARRGTGQTNQVLIPPGISLIKSINQRGAIMTDEKQECRNCYFSTVTERLDQYMCKANPPQVVLVPTPDGGIGMQSVFPVVSADTWCGKWVPEIPTKPTLTTV